jgi:hypothetical protein
MDTNQTITETSPVSAANGKKPRKKRENVTRFGLTISVAIPQTMAESLIRMCPANGPFNQSTYLRLLLHRGLMADDPQYCRTITNGGNHAT